MHIEDLTEIELEEIEGIRLELLEEPAFGLRDAVTEWEARMLLIDKSRVEELNKLEVDRAEEQRKEISACQGYIESGLDYHIAKLIQFAIKANLTLRETLLELTKAWINWSNN